MSRICAEYIIIHFSLNYNSIPDKKQKPEGFRLPILAAQIIRSPHKRGRYTPRRLTAVPEHLPDIHSRKRRTRYISPDRLRNAHRPG